MNQRNEHIGLFFGSFNPIHLGHLALANYFVDNHYVDKVWFVVSPQSPFKNSKDIAPFEHRLKMVDIAVADAENINSCDIESKMPLPSFTVDTLNELRNKYVDKKFSVILGSDSCKISKIGKIGRILSIIIKYCSIQEKVISIQTSLILKSLTLLSSTSLLQWSEIILRQVKVWKT